MANNPRKAAREARSDNEARSRQEAEQTNLAFADWLTRAYPGKELTEVERSRLHSAFSAGRKAGFAAGIMAALTAER